MNQAAFLDMLSRFAKRPLPALVGRHVYLWHGDADSLTNALPDDVIQRLDLHRLTAESPQAPRSIDAAQRVLLQAIRSQITDMLSFDRQQVLLVSGCDLLSRYQLSLGSFFEIASEYTAVVFAIPAAETHFQPIEPLPEYVSLDPHAPLDYLRRALGEENVIHERR